LAHEQSVKDVDTGCGKNGSAAAAIQATGTGTRFVALAPAGSANNVRSWIREFVIMNRASTDYDNIAIRPHPFTTVCKPPAAQIARAADKSSSDFSDFLAYQH
jgi:hypothetical protein